VVGGCQESCSGGKKAERRQLKVVEWTQANRTQDTGHKVAGRLVQDAMSSLTEAGKAGKHRRNGHHFALCFVSVTSTSPSTPFRPAPPRSAPLRPAPPRPVHSFTTGPHLRSSEPISDLRHLNAVASSALTSRLTLPDSTYTHSCAAIPPPPNYTRPRPTGTALPLPLEGIAANTSSAMSASRTQVL
jgi:hypothetical protein